MISKNKSHFSVAAIVMAAFIAAPTAANAVTGDASTSTILNTSPLWADSGPSYHACNVVNVTTSAVSVRIDVLKSDGTTLATSGATSISIPAGVSVEYAGGGYSGFARCRVTVPSLSSNSVRANLTVFHWNSAESYYQTVALSEAR